MRKQIINGKEENVQERDDWKTSIDKDFKPGDFFDEEIAWDLIEAVPPHKLSRTYFQCGEPYSHKINPQTNRWEATYLTLVKVTQEPEVWKFIGYCFTGEEQEQAMQEQNSEEY